MNAVSKKDAYPLPDIQDALDNLRGSKYYVTIDVLSGYWQVGYTERAKERSAFCIRRSLFQFTHMPFGLSGAPASFCRLMQIILSDHLWIIGSRPTDHYFRSVCWFVCLSVCLCRVFLSRL